MTDCEDYLCRCQDPEEDFIPGITAPGYCRCGCAMDDHGKGFRAAEQRSADEGRAAIAEVAEAIHRSFREGVN